MTLRPDDGAPPATTPSASLILRHLVAEGALTRAELCARTGLTGSAVTKVTKPLVEAGYLEEASEAEAGGPRRVGRPVSPLRARPDRAFFLGVKITDDELIGAVTDLRAVVRATRHRPLPATDVETVVGELANLVGELKDSVPEHAERVAGLGVSLAGAADPVAGIAHYSPFLDWREVPLARLVTEATGLPTVIENDVNALTMAEHWFGAGAGTSSFVLVSIGAGIGCGIVVDGTVVGGTDGVAGEIGHIPLGPAQYACACGGQGCVEAVASSRAIVRRVADATGDPDLTLPQAIALARQGHPAAAAAFAEAGQVLGLALATVANLIGPERLAITGEALVAYTLFADEIRAAFQRQAYGPARHRELTLRPHTFDEWARGAAVAALQRFLSPPRPR